MRLLLRGLVPTLVLWSLLVGCGHKDNLFLEVDKPEKQAQPMPQPPKPAQPPAQGS